MTCNETSEFISALCDGETIPSAAAEHIGACETCQVRLREYLEIGAELRRIASVALSEPAPPRVWNKPQNLLTRWWQKGWETMRIPRLAFVSLMAIILLLGSSLAIVGVRAHSEGAVLLLHIASTPDQPFASCALSTVDKKLDSCGSIGGSKAGILGYEFKFLSRNDDRVTLGLHAKYSPLQLGTAQTAETSFDSIRSLPEKQYTFAPGETLQVEVEGFGKIAVTGEWMDHMPAFADVHDLDPGPNELRVVSPVLLQDKSIVDDLEGMSAFSDRSNLGIVIYLPAKGRFVFALSPFVGAVPANIRLNRISFEADGKSYVLLTGTPITRSKEVWTRQDPDFKPSKDLLGHPYIGTIDLNQVAFSQ